MISRMEVEETVNRFGQEQIIFKSGKGKISLVNFTGFGTDRWEIYCLEGELFDDIECFDEKEEAVARVKELLKVVE